MTTLAIPQDRQQPSRTLVAIPSRWFLGGVTFVTSALLTSVSQRRTDIRQPASGAKAIAERVHDDSFV